MIILFFFFIIALMRVVQSVCNKRVSNEVKDNRTFFLYGVYYQALAAVFSLLTLCFLGFERLTLSTVACGFVTAAFLMLNFYANLNAIKGCKLIVASMFGYGGMLVCCILSWIMFGEEMSALQGVGLILFFLSAYMISSTKKETAENEARPITKKIWLLLLVVMFSEGFVEISQKYFSLRVSGGNVAWYSFFMFLFSTAFMGFGFILSLRKGGKNNISKEQLPPPLKLQEETISKNETESVAGKKVRLNKLLLVCGALLALAVFVINTLVAEMGKKVNSVIMFPVMALISICITVFVGRIVYKEKLSMKNIFGVILGLIAVIVLSVCTPETLSKFFS